MRAARFRKKPVVIEAVQWLGGPESVDSISEWVQANGGKVRYYAPGELTNKRGEHNFDRIAVETLEGTMLACPGDWIIRGVKGEFYPCKPDIFEATYEQMPS